ncbi:hypothetical protein [Enterococcus rivorum]|uniref:Uncharacterized protein n=1 Tax=Enterococcus rivorum TaxID=762845 RepID=A0A1E5KX09_9ENTE|nr:hypothetical protein [Enterococcus rivorum]MBP2097242.1 hypothetical protein [Enterococcus rivorum]OEH82404.1 hypothetical protein BCR26_02940 [Enterococcus rivorum]
MKKIKKNQRSVLLIAIVMTLVIAIVGGAFFLKGMKTSAIDYDEQATSYETRVKKPESIADGSISFPGFKSITIEEGGDKLYIALLNPSFNKADIQFIMTLEGREKPLLESGLVQPGKAITEVSLPKDLAVGEHKINLEMLGYTQDKEHSRLSGSKTSFTLHVKEKGREFEESKPE